MKRMLTLCIFLSVLVCCVNPPPRIQVGFNTWAGYQTIVLAEKLKIFANEGLAVDLHQYRSLDEVMQAFLGHQIDVLFSTLHEVFLLADQGQPIKIVMVTDYSNGADAIIAQKQVHNLANLRHKKVAVQKGSLSHYILLRALQTAGLTEQDIQIVNVDNKTGLQQFLKNQVDAVVSWSPFYNGAIKAGGHIIFSTRQLPGEIVDVMSMRQDLMNRHISDCFKVVSSYFKALDWFQGHFHEGLKILATSANMSEEAFQSELEGIKITNYDDNLIEFGIADKKGPLYATSQNMIQFLFEHRFIHHLLNANELISPIFIWEHKKQTADKLLRVDVLKST